MTINFTFNKTILLIVLALLVLPGISFGQSDAIKKFEEKVNGNSFFVYQSVIRVFNQDRNEDFNKLIKDLDHLKIMMTDSIGPKSTELFKKLKNELGGEGYDELMTFENSDSEAIVFSKDTEDGNQNWIVIFELGGQSGLFEMKGSINTKYLGAISSLNMEMVKSVVPLTSNELIEIRHDLEEDE